MPVLIPTFSTKCWEKLFADDNPITKNVYKCGSYRGCPRQEFTKRNNHNFLTEYLLVTLQW